MDTTITITVEQLLIWVLLFVAIIAIIYVIVLLSRASKMMAPLSETITKANSVLDDIKVITSNAKDSTEDARRAVRSASNAIHDVAHILDVNRMPITAITGLAAVGTSLANLSRRKNNKRK